MVNVELARPDFVDMGVPLILGYNRIINTGDLARRPVATSGFLPYGLRTSSVLNQVSSAG